MLSNTNTISVDTKDTYFHNNGDIVFNKNISDIAKVKAIDRLISVIPSRILDSYSQNQTFGCPDCTDGCGIYFEFQRGSVIKKIHIDYQSANLDEDIRNFAESIKNTVTALRSKG